MNISVNHSLRLFLYIFLYGFLLVACLPPSVSARSLTLAWDPSEDPTVDRYVVYWGTRSGDYSQNSDERGHIISADTTAYQVTGLSSSRPYFFAVKAVSDFGPSSDFSDEAAIPAIAELEDGFELSVSRNETFNLFGIAAANQSVDVYNSSTRIGSTIAGPDGAWSLPVNGTLLGEGPVQLSASSTGAESEPLWGEIRLLSTPTPGDLDYLHGVDLADAVIALKVVSGIPIPVSADRDATGDRRIGIPDAVFILQTVSGLRGV